MSKVVSSSCRRVGGGGMGYPYVKVGAAATVVEGKEEVWDITVSKGCGGGGGCGGGRGGAAMGAVAVAVAAAAELATVVEEAAAWW